MEATAIREAGLIWAQTDAPGFSRRRRGRGWSYLDPAGERVGDEAVRARLDGLAVPPAWRDAWYCLDARGHIQATATDDRERRQYVYHADWRAWRDRTKFAELAGFVEALPAIRRAWRKGLEAEGVVDRAIACVVALLDRGALRIGSERYAKENGSFGATTLRKRHVEADGRTLRVAFRAKAGKWRDVAIRDPRLAKTVRALGELPGQRLFDLEDEEGGRVALSSGQVNRWLQAVTGETVTAKDFRTLAGTVAAFEALLPLEPGETRRARDAALKQAWEAAAERLGNTPTVARTAYVHPALAERWAEGQLGRLRGRARRMKLRVPLSERAVALLARDAA